VNLRSNGRTDGVESNGDAAPEGPAVNGSSHDGAGPDGSGDDGVRVSRLDYGRHLRVLLVDGDDETAGAFLAAAEEAVLEVRVEVASGVDDAMERLDRAVGQRRRRGWPDIVISALDVAASHDLLGRLRDDDRFDAVPVIVLSEESSASLERRSFALGAAGHLRAPRVDYERVALVHALPDFMPTARAALAQLESRR
jgi:CheY-like chemotaxis protein